MAREHERLAITPTGYHWLVFLTLMLKFQDFAIKMRSTEYCGLFGGPDFVNPYL
jgi:hypothetical protein